MMARRRGEEMPGVEIACRLSRTTIIPMAKESSYCVISYDDAVELLPDAPHVAIVPIDIWEEILKRLPELV